MNKLVSAEEFQISPGDSLRNLCDLGVSMR